MFYGQYTNADTGLSYLRARTYDPATTQFMTVDPLVWRTRAPYTYAGDNPLNFGDPTGRAFQVCVGGTVSLGFFIVEANACYVNTPGGLAVSGGASRGPGFGANVHAGQVAVTLKPQKNTEGRLPRLGVSRKLDSVATQAGSSAKVRAALWLVVQGVFQPGLGPRLELEAPTQKCLPSKDGMRSE